MNMYHIGLSDGAVLHYALRLKIYGATTVFMYIDDRVQVVILI